LSLVVARENGVLGLTRYIRTYACVYISEIYIYIYMYMYIYIGNPTCIQEERRVHTRLLARVARARGALREALGLAEAMLGHDASSSHHPHNASHDSDSDFEVFL